MSLKIYLGSNIDDGAVSMVEDVVFARHDPATGQELDSFSLNLVMTQDAEITFEEAPYRTGQGEVGIHIYLLDVNVRLFQNNSFDADRIQQHNSYLWSVHILFQNGFALSSRAITAKGVVEDLKVRYKYLKERYNNIDAWRYDFGIPLRVIDKTPMSDRSLTIVGKGATVEKVNYYCGTTAAGKKKFYQQFPNYNKIPNSAINNQAAILKIGP